MIRFSPGLVPARQDAPFPARSRSRAYPQVSAHLRPLTARGDHFEHLTASLCSMRSCWIDHFDHPDILSVTRRDFDFQRVGLDEVSSRLDFVAHQNGEDFVDARHIF